MTCKDCHYGTKGGNEVDTTGNRTQDVTAHAAGVAVNCIGCHSYPTYYDNVVSKDYDVTGVNVSKELALPGEAHKYLANATTSTGGIYDRDLACVGCHTRVNVNFTDTHLNVQPQPLNITLTRDEGNNDWMYSNYEP